MGRPTRSAFLYLVAVLLFVGQSKAVPELNQCKAYTLLPTNTAISGTWYLYSQTTSIHSLPFRCVSFTFGTAGANGRIPLTINGRIPTIFGTGLSFVTNGELMPFTVGTVINYRLRIEGPFFSMRDFRIITANAAAPTTWFAAQSCTSFHKHLTEQVYIFTNVRGSAPPAAANAALTTAGMGQLRFVQVYQSRC